MARMQGNIERFKNVATITGVTDATPFKKQKTNAQSKLPTPEAPYTEFISIIPQAYNKLENIATKYKSKEMWVQHPRVRHYVYNVNRLSNKRIDFTAMLPEEIVGEIFYLLKDIVDALYDCAHVCHRWRRMVLKLVRNYRCTNNDLSFIRNHSTNFSCLNTLAILERDPLSCIDQINSLIKDVPTLRVLQIEPTNLVAFCKKLNFSREILIERVDRDSFQLDAIEELPQLPELVQLSKLHVISKTWVIPSYNQMSRLASLTRITSIQITLPKLATPHVLQHLSSHRFLVRLNVFDPFFGEDGFLKTSFNHVTSLTLQLNFNPHQVIKLFPSLQSLSFVPSWDAVYKNGYVKNMSVLLKHFTGLNTLCLKHESKLEATWGGNSGSTEMLTLLKNYLKQRKVPLRELIYYGCSQDDVKFLNGIENVTLQIDQDEKVLRDLTTLSSLKRLYFTSHEQLSDVNASLVARLTTLQELDLTVSVSKALELTPQLQQLSHLTTLVLHSVRQRDLCNLALLMGTLTQLELLQFTQMTGEVHDDVEDITAAYFVELAPPLHKNVEVADQEEQEAIRELREEYIEGL
mmetsp:Transcript_24078/g.26725  ORF Transcript_24078/g.26725 Transcript_24078/m.26725 type:complete len:577 (+) Transcript_24078:103-1833(+)|eukprot:CAMPEP_0168519580 /NCGR_PEP_ID=MMETSP0405-20121227/7408_1 /TAXON_ID=498012 /ORGANISM="Trichosphaerium sp, Strain Am-I-7 wt" /LENGTH=576 /DNA_ID=CAMNT_0008540161 /DNA_START=58 /DNA_END=1788 /DNA_ORIENTATION=+